MWLIAASLRAFFLWLSERRWLGRLAMAIPLIRRMPHRFVAGTLLDQAVEVVRALNARGAMVTLDVLGESAGDRARAQRAAAAYVATVDRIAADELNANVSIKLTQMGLDLGVEECIDILMPVVAAADRHRVFVRIDMESSAYTERTIDVVLRLRAAGYDVGPVIQAYLFRSAADLESLAARRVRTRICKGAYAESAGVAMQERASIADAFRRNVESLLEADAYPGVATHDPEIIESIRDYARAHGISPDRFEFQMLYGVRRDLQRRLLEQGYLLRVYVPYGTEWWPYFMRRLAERPANVMFVIRSLFGERS